MITDQNAGSPEDTGGKKPALSQPAEGSIMPPEEELKELLKRTPDDLNLDNDQDLEAEG